MPLGAFKAALMGASGVSTGDVVLLGTATASSSATLAFTSGITSTYGEYVFRFYDIHPQTDQANLTWQVSTDGGSNYGMTITSSSFVAYHNEDDAGGSHTVGYHTALHLTQSTAEQRLLYTVGNEADNTGVGELHLFNPASTTYAKQWMATTEESEHQDMNLQSFTGGYINSTDNVDAIRFKFSSGNIDAGKIKMWGVK